MACPRSLSRPPRARCFPRGESQGLGVDGAKDSPSDSVAARGCSAFFPTSCFITAISSAIHSVHFCVWVKYPCTIHARPFSFFRGATPSSARVPNSAWEGEHARNQTQGLVHVEHVLPTLCERRFCWDREEAKHVSDPGLSPALPGPPALLGCVFHHPTWTSKLVSQEWPYVT